MSLALACAAATKTGLTVSVPSELAVRSPFAKSTSIAETTAATLGERKRSCCRPDRAKTHTIRTPNAPTAAPPRNSTRRRSRFPLGKSGLSDKRLDGFFLTYLFSHAAAKHKTRACAPVLYLYNALFMRAPEKTVSQLQPHEHPESRLKRKQLLLQAL